MKIRSVLLTLFLSGLTIAPAWSQSNSDQTTTQQKTKRTKHKGRSAGGDIGSGAGDVGKGAAKAAGSAAKGVGEGAVDLVTLHPINAATSVGRGGVDAGKNVAIGTVKGTGKMVRGVGKGIKHLF